MKKKMDEETREVSRRDFIKTSAVVSLAGLTSNTNRVFAAECAGRGAKTITKCGKDKVRKLDFAWAGKRWKDPTTGTEVVRLSPEGKIHWCNNYFRLNTMTADGQYAVFCGFEKIRDGSPAGKKFICARNLFTGEVRDLGEIPNFGRVSWAVSGKSHLVNVKDGSEPDNWKIIQIDIDSGKRRVITPKLALPWIYDGVFSADDKYVYTPWLVEKGEMTKTMSMGDVHEMLAAQPGLQWMVRINLETGEVEKLFKTSIWWMGHPNPHPVYPNLFMCCQEGGFISKGKWGSPVDFERIRVLDLKTMKWLNTNRRSPVQSYHEHWALQGKRIYAHAFFAGIHAVNRIDLETGENAWFSGERDVGLSDHVRVAPNEKFLVGDGRNFALNNLTPDIIEKLNKLPDGGVFMQYYGKGYMNCTNGGEIIWKYEIPSEPIWEYDWNIKKFRENIDSFCKRLADNPDKALKTTPICRFRTLCRTKMLGYRLESNAHATPDSRWVVFQSSSEDDFFEVWAARVHGT